MMLLAWLLFNERCIYGLHKWSEVGGVGPLKIGASVFLFSQGTQEGEKICLNCRDVKKQERSGLIGAGKNPPWRSV